MQNNEAKEIRGKNNLDLKAISECRECTCFNLRKASRVVTRMFDDAMRSMGLRGTQFILLAHAFAQSPITITRLAEMIVTDRTTLARNLSPLERSGFITLRAGEDRRQRIVEITDLGREKLYEAYPIWKETQDKIKQKLGTGKWNSMMTNMSELVEKVKGD